jgi:hypothetical protein
VSFNVENLADQLDSLFNEPAPPSTFDAGLAAAAGRKILRRRRWLAMAAVAATTGLAGALVATVPAGHGGTTAAIGTSLPALPTGADPLVVPGDFGWLPANAQNIEYTFAPGQQVSTVAKGSGSGDSVASLPAMFWLSAYAPGQTPTLGTFATGARQLRVDAPPVNGRTAFWVTATASDPTNGSDTYLVWQTPQGRWAELHGYYLGNDPIESTMLRVAAGVTLGAIPVPLPVSISGLPATAVANEIDAQRPSAQNAAWEVNLIFAVGGSFVSIIVHATGGAGAAMGATSPATSGVTPSACDSNRNGLAICVSSVGATDNPLLPGGLPGLLKSITSLGPDPKNWTTNVLLKK